MIIGIDGNEANVTRRVGIGEYAYQLLCHLSLLSRQDLKIVVYLKSYPLSDMPKERENLKYKIIKPKKYWTQMALPIHLLLTKSKPDVFFTPSHYAPRFSRVPTVISIMDLSYILFPDLFNRKDLVQLRRWTLYSVRQAKRVLTISNSSKGDIIKHYGIRSENVIVTYPGIKMINSKQTFISLSELKQKYKINGEYILFVGTLQPRKNITRLIEAFSKIKDDEINLVIVGKKGWKFEEILDAPQKYNIKKRVHFLFDVSEQELPSFYKNAKLFVLPSLYEGFGLPVIEAMQYGCPVITSQVSSLPEAGGDAAEYVDPESITDICRVLDQVLLSQSKREEMIKKGFMQVKKFNWEKTAQETLSVLESLNKT